ncbi:MAG TPA: ATP-binding protein [Ideonella sp.]|uniref:ATP-binding protein n=1 Tax=Ideonella sp. TaxID=1929293 RepID=UPI002E33B004|nr:ATP-binding protein [Ideonella sp.]HEX5686424.1 ATP-binding protein [Ideonella sp.]
MPARRSSLSLLRGYLLAVLITLLAFGLQWVLRPWLGHREPFIVFLPAIALAAAIGGRGPGLLPLGTGIASAALWLPLVGPNGASDDPADWLSLLLFCALGALLAELGSIMRRTGERALAAEERLVMAIQGTGIGVFDIDLVAETAYVSPALARLVNLPVSSSAVPLPEWLARTPPELLAESRRYLTEKFRARSRGYEREIRVLQSDGSPLWLLLRVHLTWVEDRAVRLRGACVDITERKAVDSQLSRAKAELSQQVDDLDQLHELSSNLPDAGTLREQLQMVLVTLARFHGCGRGLVFLLEPQGRRLCLEASIGFSAETRARLASVALGEGVSGVVGAQRERVVVPDTEVDQRFAGLRDMARQEGFRAVHSTPLLSLQGNVLGVLSVYLDQPREPTERECALADICARKAAVFSERARAQAALEESQGRFRAVLETSAVPFIVLTPLRNEAGEIVDFSWNYMNGAAAQSLQRTPTELLGRPLAEVLPKSWADSDAFQQYVAVARDRQTREFEARTRLRGGEGWVHCIASPMRESVAVWFNDITDRKKNEQLLREADRRKDEFLATLAHELRNPLAPIRQAAQLSTASNATDAQKRWSQEVIERQVQHMALLLDDLLDVSRITRGVLPLRKTGTELSAVVASAVETARPAIDGMAHQLVIELPPDPVHFEADPLRLAQVVANLLTNAAKYTDRGGHIRLSAQRQGGDIQIEVSDDGIGIAPGSMPEVFRMFSQLQSTGERSSAGLGIGLALSKGLVELHGGSIAVHSAGPGAGSTFTVRLPAGDAAADARQPAGSSASTAAAPRKVLIADDNRDAADSLAALLQLEGHETRLSFDGNEALSTWQRFDPDVCLFDIGMPGRNGYELARAIRGLPGGHRPVLIAITGWGQESDRHLALQAGFNHHLTKPVDPQRLTALFG